MAVRKTPAKQQQQQPKPPVERKLLSELVALFFVFFTLLAGASLLTHSQADPGMNHTLGTPVAIHNAVGLFGAYLSSALADMFGIAAYFWPALFLMVALRLTLWRRPMFWWRWAGFFLLGLCVSWGAEAFGLRIGGIHGGGLLGFSLHSLFSLLLSPFGACLLWLAVMVCSLRLLLNISFAELARLLQKGFFHARAFALNALGKDGEAEPGLSLKAAEPAVKPEIRFPRPREDEQDAKAQALLEGSGEGSDEGEVPWYSPNEQAGQGEAILSDNPGPADEEEAAPQKPRTFSLFGVRKLFHKKDAANGPERADTARQAEQAFETEQPQPAAPYNSSYPVKTQHVADALAAEQVEPIPDWLSAAFGDTAPRPVPIAQPIASAPPKAEQAHLLPPQESQPAPAKRSTRKVPLPGLDLLAAPTGGATRAQRDVLEEKGRRVMACLSDFGVQGELVGITPGPVVTMFEVRPAPGVKVSRIAGLSDDLALALKAIAVRIQAPIPGTDTVGIEIPNEQRETVSFRELLASPAFKNSQSLLSMAIGKDIAGTPTVSDLAQMPHLLVAGATGAGKSVCLNSILLSLLYKARPDEVRLLLVDPKRVELAVYEGLPHLVHPVVTEMHHAKNALDWAVHEMENRYKAMTRLGVKHIAVFNEKLASFNGNPPPELADLQPVPYLIIIIDELADLMLTASKEVETSIVRLAQLARAAGMHMIIATQRPSVDVVTGLIKANFPCRISFQVTSKHDSRTILDTVGAEHLLGKGDMLFKPSGGRLRRLHGAFVSDEEVYSVVQYWKRQLPPAYLVDLTDWSNESATGPVSSGADSDDAQYGEAVDFVRSQGRASISQIQRRFRIGFNKAARYVEQMEQDGIIGPADGSRPREVIRP